MLPVDIFPTKRDYSDLCTFGSNNDGTIKSFSPKREVVTRKKPCLSFMIEDILSDSRNKNETTHDIEESPSSPCNKCLPSPTDDLELPAKTLSEQHFYLSQGPSRLLPSTTSAFLPPHSPSLVHARYGYYSPAIASSPPFSSSSRSPNVFTFHPSDFNEHVSAAYYNRQDSCVRPTWCSPSAILDLTNYGQKLGSARILPSSVIALPNTSVECTGGRQIIWKHINRTSAKRKGGQIRFTNEQTTTLENTFAEHKYLSSSERKRLATVLRLSERQVKTWFQNRRAKWRRVKQDPTSHVSSSESEDCNTAN